MDSQDKQAFGELMSALGEVWTVEFTAIQTEMYWNTLKDYTLDAVKSAANRILKEYKYAKFPVPAEFTSRINPDETTAKAIKAWESAQNALTYWAGSGQYQESRKEPDFQDVIVDNVINSYFGGWHNFYEEWNESGTKISFLRREFIHAYEVMAGSTTFNPQLPEAELIKQLGIGGGH